MEKRRSYVYKLTCLVTGEYYFGSSFYAKRNSYLGGGSKIRERVAQYGKENFVKEILGEFDDRVEAHKVENEYIEKFRNDDNCINERLEHHFGLYGEESRTKNSAAKCGEKNPWYGKHLSEEVKAKMSISSMGNKNAVGNIPWNKGKHLSEEMKQKISESLKGITTWNKGKHLSKEHIAKLSAVHRGKTLSEEHKARIGAFNRGKIVSDDTRSKMSAAHIGKHLSEETKQKIREYLKGRTPWNKGKKLNKETGKYE